MAVRGDPHRSSLTILLWSIDSHVDIIVVTWYNDDDNVGDGFFSFLGDKKMSPCPWQLTRIEQMLKRLYLMEMEWLADLVVDY